MEGGTLESGGTPTIDETQEGNTIRLSHKIGGKRLGSISMTLTGDHTYEIGAVFVDPSQRGGGIGSRLVQAANDFLKKENAVGHLVDMAHGDSAGVYESNGWVRGAFKSHDAYGGYEYIFDGRSAPEELKDEGS